MMVMNPAFSHPLYSSPQFNYCLHDNLYKCDDSDKFSCRLISATDCCFCCPAIVIVVGLSRAMSSNCFVALKNGWDYVPGPNLYVLLSLCGAMPRGGIWPGGWKYYYTTTCKILRVLTAKKDDREGVEARDRETKKEGERCFENWAKLGECDSDNK